MQERFGVSDKLKLVTFLHFTTGKINAVPNINIQNTSSVSGSQRKSYLNKVITLNKCAVNKEVQRTLGDIKVRVDSQF